MYNFEIYESNGGTLFLVVLDKMTSQAIEIFGGWEYPAYSGTLKDAINQLEENENAWQWWDGNETGEELTAEQLYVEIYTKDELIMWCYDSRWGSVGYDLMGFSARTALGLD